MVTSETLNASKNAFRYMGAIKFAGSQSSTHAPRRNELLFLFISFDEWLVFCIIITKPLFCIIGIS